jgi:pimeloyl-ACP methyl ester carboxylesterase
VGLAVVAIRRRIAGGATVPRNTDGDVLHPKEAAVRKADIEALGELAGDALAGGGGVVGAMHAGIAERAFGATGPAATPVRVVHDGISRAVYAGVRGALRVASRAGGAGAAVAVGDEGSPPLASTVRGSIALGALNGLYGDHLAAGGSALAVPMGLRRDGVDVPATPAGLAAAYPDATSRVAVFVHGLFGDDACWRLFPMRDRAGRRTYGERLQDELSYTPLHVRYATGLRISDNGRALSALLEDVLAAWPVRADEVVLIGHSMGGLVARSACHYGERDQRRWVDAVHHVISLGSPHLGADLEKGVHALGWALKRLPETRALAQVLDARSVGIKDLRFGAVAEEDWRDADPDEWLRDRCTEVPFLPHAHYCFVGTTLRPGPVGDLLGDLLVRMPSASGRGSGRGRRIPFAVDDGHELTGASHMDLLNHPAVYDQLVRWLTRTPGRRTLPATG